MRAEHWDVVYTCYAVKQHAGWRNLGSRFANAVAGPSAGQTKGPLSVVVPLHGGIGGASGHPLQGPYPYVDGLIMQVTQHIDSIEVRHLPRVEGRCNYTLRGWCGCG